jgi:hypothetical protein
MTIRGIALTALLSEEVTVQAVEMTCEQAVAALAVRMAGCFTDATFTDLCNHDQKRNDVELRKKDASTNHEKETITQDYRVFKAARDEAYDGAAMALKKLIADRDHAEERKLLELVGGSKCRRSALRDVVHLLVDDWRVRGSLK